MIQKMFFFSNHPQSNKTLSSSAKALKMLTIFVFVLFAKTVSGQMSVSDGDGPSTVLPEKCGFDAIHQFRMKNDPTYANNVRQADAEYKEFLKNPIKPKAVRKIPVVVHVIHTGETIGHQNNISDAQIISAVNNLTNAFRKIGSPYSTGGGADCELEFCLAQRDPNNNPTTGILRVNGSSVSDYAANGITNANRSAVQALSFWDNRNYYNIWVVIKIDGSNGTGTQGYAQLASAGAGGYSASDGTVILGNAMGYDPTGSLGYQLKSYTRKNGTLIHEVGHAMGLYHTFTGDGSGADCPTDAVCGTSGDCVADTPKHKRSTSNCPANTTTNPCQAGSTAIEYVHNFMDYSNEDCTYLFTEGQKTRMNSFMVSGKSRYSLTQSNGCSPVYVTDVGISAIVTPSATFCKTNITPVVTLKNYGSGTITSATIKYQIDGGTLQTFAWTGTLTNNQEINVTLPNMTTSNGAHTFTAYTESPNGTADQNTSNDSKTGNFNISAASIPFVQDFEGTTFPPAGWSLDESPAGYQQWSRYTGAHYNGTSTGIAGILFTSSSNLGGNKDMIITEPIALSSSANNKMTFKLYTKYVTLGGGAYYDTLKIYISEDCGATYQTPIYIKGAAALATAGISSSIPGNHYPTSSTQYRTDTVSLAAYAGESVIFKFEHIDWGAQNFLLDDINVFDPCVSRAHPGALTGATTVCQDSSGVVYSIAAVAGATGYVWKVPAGATILSGQNTASISVKFGTVSGDSIKVYTTHSQCGNSDTSFLKITVNPKPAAAGAIVGDATGCSGESKVYSIPAVNNATGYTWTVPSGTTITAGQNTNSITVTVGSTSGSFSVTPTNSCGKGTSSTLAVTYNSAGVLSGSISGPIEVCPNATGVQYSITPIAGSTSYTWTVPADAAISGVSNGSSITVNFGTQSGSITVNSQNSCGNSNTLTKSVTVNATPSIPDAITGPTDVCANATNQSYSVQTPVTGVTYQWTVPSGATISGASNGSSINVNFGTQSGNITVKAVSSCGESPVRSLAVTVSQTPATPGSITCSTTVCTNQTGVPISVAAVPGATTYNWTLPAGASIVSGAGTNSISVNFGSNGGNISVTAQNQCGTSSASTKSVSMESIPSTPASITGKQNVCTNSTSENYSTPSISNASSYSWSVTGAGTFIGATNTTNVNVNWNGGGGTLEVTASNFCGTSAPKQITITPQTVTSPPDNITGPSEVCANQTGVNFQVQTPESGVTYQWTVPAGASIVGASNGPTITVNFQTTGGNIAASADAGCGWSSATTKAVTLLNIPTTPGAISCSSTVCVNQTGVAVSVAAVPGATTYNWTLPAGAMITSGAGTNSITVDFGANGGNISVTAQNQCGTSAASTKSVSMESIPNSPSHIDGNQVVCVNSTSENYSTPALANATSFLWSISGLGSFTSSTNTSSVTVNWNGGGGTLEVTASNFCGTSSPKQITVSPKNIAAAPNNIVGSTDVCENQTGVVYSVQTPESGATYQWTLPAGATISGASNGSSITVNYGTNGGNVAVSANTGCGWSSATSLAITMHSIPATPGTISCSSTVCQNQTGVAVSVAAVPGATTYNWTLPAGATISSGAGSNSIIVNFGSNGGTVSVSAQNQCGTSTASTKVIGMESIPSQPVFSSGNTVVCVTSLSEIYSVQNQSNASSYSWTISNSATFNSNNNSQTVDVNWNGTSGTIQVTADNFCGSSAAALLNVSVVPVSIQPDTILGLDTVCATSTNVSYSIQTPQSGALYTWTVPAGSSIVGPATGSSIVVNFGTTSGPISVSGNTGCGSSTLTSKPIHVTPLPSAPGTISSSSNVCEGQDFTATVNQVSGMTYNWTVPSGWVISSGQGSNSVTITLGANSGDISVTAVTSCGASLPSYKSISVTSSGETLVITGDDKVCPGTGGLVYTASGITNPGTFTWSTPSDASITAGHGTNTIDVDFGLNSGLMTVSTSNACGTHTADLSISIEQIITDNSIPANVTGCEGTGFTINGSPIVPTKNYNITWQKANQISGPYTNDATSTSDTISGTIGTAGTSVFYRRVAIYYGCVDTSNLCEVISLANPKVLNSDMDSLICSNQQVLIPTMIIQDGSIGTWTHDGQGTLQNASGQNPTYVSAAGDQGGLVTLEFTMIPANNCSSTTFKGEYYLLVKPSPQATGSGSQEICPSGLAVNITGFSASNGDITWSHTGQGTLTNANTSVPTYASSANDAGITVILTMTVTDNTCTSPLTSSANYSLVHRASIIDPSINVNAGSDISLNENEVANLSGSGNNLVLHHWSPGSSVADSMLLQTTAQPTNTTTYVLTGYNNKGCLDRDSVVVTVNSNEESETFIPSLFSPNSDGINDKWNIPSLENYTNLKVQVYNREGLLVFESDNYKHDWDGTFQKQKLPDATYYYVVEVPGKKDLLKGVVSIVSQ